MSFVETGLSTAVLVLDIALIGALAIFASKRLGYSSEYIERLNSRISENTVEIVFGVSLIATLGSLYFSNILGYTPCRLCWFQRILMYPIALVSGTALFLEKSGVRDYVMALALIGAPIALYHSLIQRYKQFTASGCSVTAVSCSTEYTFHYGYITIPVMALTALLVIMVVMWRFDD